LERTKPFVISKWTVQEAYEAVKRSRGSAGIDGQSIAAFEENRKDNLYKLWNRMSSGTYFPPPVNVVPIPKKSGGTRILGVPTVADRVAQTVVKAYFEPCVEPIFHEDSYGYRPDKSAHDAIGVTRKRCWKYDWVLEFDIKGLFDNIDHELLMAMVECHSRQRWVTLYIKRWLTAPFQAGDRQTARTSGTPQGGVISPVLANLFLHYVFDSYMAEEFPNLPWARYADDGVCHCVSKEQACYLKDKLEQRFKEYKLELHPEKTKIVYCGMDKDIRKQENISFDFLGYTFKPRSAIGRGRRFTNMLPAIADKAKKRLRQEITGWKLQRQTKLEIEDIAKLYNPKIRGWINYYGKYYRSELNAVLAHINRCLMKWVRREYKNCNSFRKARRWLRRISDKKPTLFVHWEQGLVPTAG